MIKVIFRKKGVMLTFDEYEGWHTRTQRALQKHNQLLPGETGQENHKYKGKKKPEVPDM